MSSAPSSLLCWASPHPVSYPKMGTNPALDVGRTLQACVSLLPSPLGLAPSLLLLQVLTSPGLWALSMGQSRASWAPVPVSGTVVSPVQSLTSCGLCASCHPCALTTGLCSAGSENSS